MKDLLAALFMFAAAAAPAFAGSWEDAEAAHAKGSYQSALSKLQPLATAGDARAENLLGFMYLNGQGVKEDNAQALVLFRRAAEKGSSDGQRNLGKCYYGGWGVKQDYAEAMKWFRLAAGQGDPGSTSLLGTIYELGQGVNKDETQAARWFLAAAEKGNAHAQYRMGVFYEYGLGVGRNSTEAARWYKSASAQGNSDATKALSGFDERNRIQAKYDAANGGYKDYIAMRNSGMREGACLLGYKLAVQGDIEAQNAFGEELVLPNSVCPSVLNKVYVPESVWAKHAFPESDLLASTKNTWVATGLEFLARAAERGQTDAQSWMGRIYGPIEYGTVAVQSWQKSEFWLKKSAEGGSRWGAYYYARYLDEKKEDQSAASRWYLFAAQNGILAAQRQMAYRYGSGNGVPKDPDQAGYWLKQLADQTVNPGMRMWARRQLGYR